MGIAETELQTAFDRIEAFLAVQRGVRGAHLAGAVDCLQAAAGIGPHQRRAIAHGLARLDALDPRAGDVMLGVLIATLAATEAAREPLA
jgi:hypothetical protein